MSIVLNQEQARLRLSPGATGLDERGESGVLLWVDIPVNAAVTAYLDRPTELVDKSDGGQGAVSPILAPYKFERGPLPGPFIAGSSSWLTRSRVLVTDGYGKLVPFQMVPTFVAFAAPQTGSLAQKGRKTHQFTMPGANTLPAKREILRLRWTGAATAAQNQGPGLKDPVTGVAVAPDGARTKFRGQLGVATPAINIVPGSVKLHATIGGQALDLLDAGDGRVVGLKLDANGNVLAQGVAILDYLTGVYVVTFGGATGGAPDGATTITADYEDGCRYKPIDVTIEWDALLQ